MEIWKDIYFIDIKTKELIDYRGLYQISNQGRVKSLKYNHGNKEKELKQKIDKDGYKECCLMKDDKRRYFRVHRLVAYMFIENPTNKYFIDHINTIKDDNRADNLRWVTMKENQNNELTNNKRKESLKGERNPNYNKHGKDNKNSIPVIQCDKDGNFIKRWDSISDASKSLKLHTTDISKVCRGISKTCGKCIWFYEKDYNALLE